MKHWGLEKLKTCLKPPSKAGFEPRPFESRAYSLNYHTTLQNFPVSSGGLVGWLFTHTHTYTHTYTRNLFHCRSRALSPEDSAGKAVLPRWEQCSSTSSSIWLGLGVHISYISRSFAGGSQPFFHIRITCGGFRTIKSWPHLGFQRDRSGLGHQHFRKFPT